MRLFKALIISLLVYALFIWLFMTYVPRTIKMPIKEKNHVIKINIMDIPTPSKPKEKVLPKKTQKIHKKKIVKKKLVRKKLIKKKKPVKKKKIIKKKKIVKKKKKVVVKKTPSKKKVYVPKKRVPKKVIPPKIVEEEIFEEVVTPPKTQSLEAFESEMVYMAEPMIKPKSVSVTAPTPWSYPNNKIKKLYGASFGQFTPTQKKFIENNLDTIQAITQRTLSQRGYPKGAGRTGQEGTNVVSFNLHPNGDISDLRLKTRIGYRALDENTLSLIRVAYMDYPYPTTTTRIVFYVTYSINGY